MDDSQFMPADVFFAQQQLGTNPAANDPAEHFKRASLMQLQGSKAVSSKLHMFESKPASIEPISMKGSGRVFAAANRTAMPSLKENDESDLISTQIAPSQSVRNIGTYSITRPATTFGATEHGGSSSYKTKFASGSAYKVQPMASELASAAAAIARLKAKDIQQPVVSEAVSLENINTNHYGQDAGEVSSPLKVPTAYKQASKQDMIDAFVHSPAPPNMNAAQMPSNHHTSQEDVGALEAELSFGSTPDGKGHHYQQHILPSAPANTPTTPAAPHSTSKSVGVSQSLAAAAVEEAIRKAAALVSPSQLVPVVPATNVPAPQQENVVVLNKELVFPSSPAEDKEIYTPKQSTAAKGMNAGATPFTAKTQYDGDDDVVMGDAEDTPTNQVESVDRGHITSPVPMQASMPKPSVHGSTRFKLEAERLAAASAVVEHQQPPRDVSYEHPEKQQAMDAKKRVSFGVDPAAATDANPSENVESPSLEPASGRRSSMMYSKARPPTPMAPKAPVEEEEDESASSPTGSCVGEAAQIESPTMSNNPLADQVASGALQRLSDAGMMNDANQQQSPQLSSASAAVSNNPLFASSPSHPTPQSVSMAPRTMHVTPMTGTVVQQQDAINSPGSANGSAASKGLQLADKLHAVAEFLATPGGNNNASHSPSISPSVGMQQASAVKFEFSADLANVLAALDAATPLPTINNKTATRGGREAAIATTIRREAGARRRSLPGASAGLLDLAGFNLDGDRRTPELGTPTLSADPVGAVAAADNSDKAPGSVSTKNVTAAAASGHMSMNTSTSMDGAVVDALKKQVASLNKEMMELRSERDEAAGLLSGYQGSIKELQDNHSQIVIKLQAELAVMKAENNRLSKEKEEIDSQFRTLYTEKYQVLKKEAAALRQGSELMRARFAEEQKKGQEAESLRLELTAARQSAAAAQEAAAASKAEAVAAREAERLAERRAAEAVSALEDKERFISSKANADMKKAEQSIALKDKEIAALRDGLDEALHRANLSKAAKERKEAEVARKEEEICSLEVKIQELESVLMKYKNENGKFFEVKERYKKTISGLEAEVRAKTAEKASLVDMCSELMAKLEESGLSLDPVNGSA